MRRIRVVLAGLLLSHPVAAQLPADLHLRRLVAVPVGALPPVAMLMPASRNHNYWVGRLQAGTQWHGKTAGPTAVAGSLDLQWRGGSVFGVTAGYQTEGCGQPNSTCEAHPLFGARARLGLLTGGPTFAALIGDASATTTVGAEVGLGYAPNALSGRNACAVDIGMPISISLFQKVRVVSFFSPALAWDVRCPLDGSVGQGASALAGAGLGFQQLGHRGIDVSFGAQRIFRKGSGLQVGVTVTYVRLP
jgi:hypothetical protein